MSPTKKPVKAATTPDEHTQRYAEALTEYAAALEKLRGDDVPAALESFRAIAVENPEETLLAERARTYATICEQKLAPVREEPQGLDECYHQAVMLINDGEADAAVRLLDQALQLDPNSSRILYARACAWALKGHSEAAVRDLRSAIAGEPRVRFQAASDPDFEKIREEPAFIDVIEPTPTEA